MARKDRSAGGKEEARKGIAGKENDGHLFFGSIRDIPDAG